MTGSHLTQLTEGNGHLCCISYRNVDFLLSLSIRPTHFHLSLQFVLSLLHCVGNRCGDLLIHAGDDRDCGRDYVYDHGGVHVHGHENSHDLLLNGAFS